ncbi:MAG: hypothetical protein K9N07_08030 [Candidatus Cloacimonetes bacterium]|nr:hypothetical protein [Candidatus Cloacimonadota bacterium]
MDIMAHSLWSLALLPGPPSVAKVALGIAPDVTVFAASLTVQAIKGRFQPNFKTRKEMMQWYEQEDKHWVLNLYKWTHSLIIWSLVIVPIIVYSIIYVNLFPWFLLAAPLHILMDIPTHDHKSFPVEFLTPLSHYKLNGFHWSKPLVFGGNYIVLFFVEFFRVFVLKR